MTTPINNHDSVPYFPYPNAGEQTFRLEQLVNTARCYSPWYRQHFRHLPMNGWKIADLPIINPEEYWTGNCGLESWPVLTQPVSEGIVFKTGGTTGGGKLSVYTRHEWRTFITSFGRSLSSQLLPGARVANLFFAGDLYASFLFIHGALSHMEIPVCEYPFTGAIQSSTLTEQIALHGITVLAGVPATLLRYATELADQNLQLPAISTILYGSESVFTEQLQQLAVAFPKARVTSIGCASVDAGLIGASTRDCLPGEHRVFEPETIVEIIDEATGEAVDENDRTGMLVVTNLTRMLMPLIRYPTGDMAAWREPPGGPGRKFVLQGRSSLGYRLRVGYASLFPDEIGAFISETVGNCHWQLLIENHSRCDYLTLRIAIAGNQLLAERLLMVLAEKDHAIAEMIEAREIFFHVEWCGQADLILNPRTGKLQRVIDKRDYRV
ncbi:AMP-dependent synthetase [[Pantoea] beijingensis]|uniref:AMP-dependent synthetase n=1 Tax=[Pantoea] beijingensis TaxID=1324864 RepID=A0A443IHZ4_9GAMM|nr:phenylacetate--CoA ligase family protein [[Pantoea] beijingensis]RWR03640.1 AMP-dependent synthetase [[Pantoea] beijingensis]